MFYTPRGPAGAGGGVVLVGGARGVKLGGVGGGGGGGRRRLRASGRGDSAVPHVVTSTVEHPAVTECLRAWAEEGLLAFTEVGVTAEGLVDPAAVEAAVTRDTVLCTVMHSNNEVGAVNPIREIASRVRAKQPGITVHTDAAQSLGKVSVDVQEPASYTHLTLPTIE